MYNIESHRHNLTRYTATVQNQARHTTQAIQLTDMPTRMAQPTKHTTQAAHSMLCSTPCPGPQADTPTQIGFVPAHVMSSLTSIVKNEYHKKLTCQRQLWHTGYGCLDVASLDDIHGDQRASLLNVIWFCLKNCNCKIHLCLNIQISCISLNAP